MTRMVAYVVIIVGGNPSTREKLHSSGRTSAAHVVRSHVRGPGSSPGRIGVKCARYPELNEIKETEIHTKYPHDLK